MNETKTKFEYRVAYICDKTFLSQYKKLLDDFNLGVLFIVKTQLSEHTFDSLERVMQVPNSTADPIFQIEIHAANPDYSTVIMLKKLLHNINLFGEFVGTDDVKLLYFKKRLDDTIENTKRTGFYAWFSLISVVDLSGFLAIVSLAILVVLVALVLVLSVVVTSQGGTIPPFDWNKIFSTVGQSVPIAGIIVSFCFVVIFLKDKLFPPVTFVIGQGINRHKQLTNIRRWIGAILFALITGIVVNLMTRT